MLHFFRSKASSWIMKIILGLILLSFGLWGVSGIFAGHANQQIVAKVGDVKIGKEYFLHVLQQRVREANKALKGTASITVEQAISLGIHKVLLNEIVNKTILDIESRDLKLTAGLGSIKALIKSDPIFTDKNGHFDRDKYEEILKRSSVTEEQLIADKGKSLINMQLLSAVTAISNIPATLSIEMFKMMMEERYIKLYSIDPVQLMNKKSYKIMKIDAAEMEQHYGEKKESYKVPEKRRATILVINADQIAKNYKFSKSDIQQAYEEKIGDYAIPEKRDVIIWTASDKKTANALHKDLKKGHVKKHKDTETVINNVTPDDLQDVVSEVVFDVSKAPFITDPIKTEDGYQIVKIKKIKASHTQPLAVVKAQVIDDLRQQKLSEDIATLTQTIEDEVSGGSTLEEIARNHKLNIINSGFFHKSQGKLNNGIVPEMVKAAYDQAVGEDGPVVEVNQSKLFILRVDAVQPEHIPELDAVKDTVRADILFQKAKDEAAIIAKKLQSMSGNKKATDELVRANAFIQSKTMGWKTMQTIAKDKLAPKVLEKAFSQKTGVRDLVETPSGFVVIETIDTKPVEIESKLREYKETKSMLMEVLNQDIFGQYIDALKEKHGVETYDEEMDTLLS